MIPTGSKFGQNCSISHGFQDNQHFPLRAKFKMAAEIWEN